jgi:hypothetical protein
MHEVGYIVSMRDCRHACDVDAGSANALEMRVLDSGKVCRLLHAVSARRFPFYFLGDFIQRQLPFHRRAEYTGIGQEAR